MKLLTRSHRVRSALRAVLRRMPEADRRLLESVVVWVRCDTEWSAGFGGPINETAGETIPLYDLKTGNPVDAPPCRVQILFHLRLCQLYSDIAVRGLVAHEFAHAVRAGRSTLALGEWFERTNHGTAPRRYWYEERSADALAASWGFARGIRALRSEHEKVITPFVFTHERRIHRRIERRWQRIKSEARRAHEARLASSLSRGTEYGR